jgi:hypothetical protein
MQVHATTSSKPMQTPHKWMIHTRLYLYNWACINMSSILIQWVCTALAQAQIYLIVDFIFHREQSLGGVGPVGRGENQVERKKGSDPMISQALFSARRRGYGVGRKERRRVRRRKESAWGDMVVGRCEGKGRLK